MKNPTLMIGELFEALINWREYVINRDMHLYHIPMPQFWPTEEESAWATEHIIPHAIIAANKLFERYGPKFDKTDLDQTVFNGWTMTNKVKAHFNELGLSFRRFSLFVGATGAKSAVPHVDAHTTGVPMVARLNIPLRGITGAKLSWWNSSVDDPRMLERRFEQWDATQGKMRSAFSYLADPTAKWDDPAFTVNNPGPCWNHVELAHKLELDLTTETRINITAEIKDQIAWTELVNRLRACNYI